MHWQIIGTPDQLKQMENNKKWKEFTNIKPGTYMSYKGRQYGEKDEHKLMKAIVAQMKSYTNEQERKRHENWRNQCQNALEGIEGNINDLSNNIDQVMAANTQESQDHNNNNYELCIDSSDIAKNSPLIMTNIYIKNIVEQDRWDWRRAVLVVINT